jgi:hypothetical protein
VSLLMLVFARIIVWSHSSLFNVRSRPSSRCRDCRRRRAAE